jgi:hypothetical protein
LLEALAQVERIQAAAVVAGLAGVAGLEDIANKLRGL